MCLIVETRLIDKGFVSVNVLHRTDVFLISSVSYSGTGHKLPGGREDGGFKWNVQSNVTLPDNDHEIAWPSHWP